MTSQAQTARSGLGVAPNSVNNAVARPATSEGPIRRGGNQRPGGMRRRRRLFRGPLVVISVLVLVSALVVVGVRPARIIVAPWLPGLVCDGRVCTDDPGGLEQARVLYDDAFADVVASLGSAPPPPRIVFCATAPCFRTFGSSHSTATTIADLGIVIGPSGWQGFYVRHELIHHWQAYHLGLVARYRAPRWLIEGMAYALSEDPRPILVEPNQGYRTTFLAWFRTLAPGELWPAADQVART